jgi:hypothetical protein
MVDRFRPRIEQASRPLLAWAAFQPRWLAVLLVVALTAGGLMLPGPVAATALLVLAAGLGWLAYLSWPLLPREGRLLRVVVVTVVVLVAVQRSRG